MSTISNVDTDRKQWDILLPIRKRIDKYHPNGKSNYNKHNIGVFKNHVEKYYSNHPTCKEYLDNLPTSTDISEPCPICYDDIKTEKDSSILICKHIFHKKCIKNWLSQNTSCPICRFSFCPDLSDT